MRYNRLINFSATLIATLFMGTTIMAQPIFKDITRSPRERAEDIVKYMTLDEKVKLMIYDSPAIERLGIKSYNWWNEALHGVARNGNATVFPMPIGMAASFDTQLLEQIFTAISDEGRIKWNIARENNDEQMWYKGLSYWTPNINIFRDPRWGRGMETYGEDPYLTSQLGMAVVRGLQGEREEDGQIKAMACAKHFALHSGPEWARHSFNAVAPERDVWETYLPAFKDLVMKSKVDQVMFAYNRIFGFPAGANERFMRDILEKEWGFDGIVVSDCWAVKDFYVGHKWAKSAAEAAAAAVKTGMDLECGSAMPKIHDAIRQGLITEAELDQSVIKLMEYRYRMGDMGDGSKWNDMPREKLCSPEHAALALKMAHESIVLLENEGILPLKKDEKVLLMGPNAADSVVMWGNYNGYPLHTISILEGLEARGANVTYLPGVPYIAGLTTEAVIGDVASKASYDENNTTFAYDKVVRAAEGFQTIIFAGGLISSLEGEELHINAPGFKGGDRTSIELPEVQREMIKALKKAGKRIILINLSGSAMALKPESENCDAILQAWYAGESGGKAIADILYGDVNPSGKLPLTFYTDDSQLTDYESYEMKGRTYRFFEGKPLYPFGHGLSYTTFHYGKGKITKSKDGKMQLEVKVKNTGTRDGEDVLQLYVNRPDDNQGPIKTLRGYKRFALKAGEQANITIPIDEETFLWWNPSTQRMKTLAGEYILYYGNSSDEDSLQQIKYTFR